MVDTQLGSIHVSVIPDHIANPAKCKKPLLSRMSEENGATNRWEPIPENKGREYFHRENPDWEQIYEEFAKVLPDRIVKANKAEKRPRSDSNQIETPKLKRTNQGNKMSGNPGSAPPPAPPPVPPPGPPPDLSPVPPPGP
ncbi:hypothetical protein PNOK_0743400 [Pyrrhoderma noxium]|uniref:Uncharacterized protein n=1 Tax=Pyrrhoderma noxium TaxID=2282107 RepID=A0A286UCR6_9AGAM|nr:hypothetical protein PNOK_0743400 [Pyrrhoderma noxium]